MGNKHNSIRRKKRRYEINFLKSKGNNTAMQGVPKDETDWRPVVVDVVSILNSVVDVQHNSPTTKTNVQDVQDPLFVIKSEEMTELISDKQADEPPSVDLSPNTSVGSIITKVDIEPISKEAVISEPSKSTEFQNMCRLCLARDEGHWIEIFSNRPYVDCDEITPSNIAEIIEQCTTVKISKNDRLPDQLCEQCFLSLRFVHQFREKSIKSRSSLSAMVKCKEDEQRKVVNVATSQSTKRLVKVIYLKPLRKSMMNSKWHPTTRRTAPVVLPIKRTDNAEDDEKRTGDVQCELCGKILESSKLLQYHLNRHNGLTPFACTEPFCDKSFHSPMNRKSHIRNVHCIDPTFKCDLCEKAFTKAEKLKIHRTTHFPPTIPCTICGKLLRSQSSVYKHRKCHTQRLFQCEDCQKSFQNAYTLRVHRRIHTNEKPFICCKCGEAFAHNCLLKTHTEKKHSE